MQENRSYLSFYNVMGMKTSEQQFMCEGSADYWSMAAIIKWYSTASSNIEETIQTGFK